MYRQTSHEHIHLATKNGSAQDTNYVSLSILYKSAWVHKYHTVNNTENPEIKLVDEGYGWVGRDGVVGVVGAGSLELRGQQHLWAQTKAPPGGGQKLF